jgi:hypothetical protein
LNVVKKQGSLLIEASEGEDGFLVLELTGERVGLASVLSAMKQKLKDYKLKELDARKLTLTLEIGPPPLKPDDEEKQKAKNAKRYPDTPPAKTGRL